MEGGQARKERMRWERQNFWTQSSSKVLEVLI